MITQDYVYKGIDVASYQAKINWKQAYDEGYRFALVKLTGGDSYVNPYGIQQLYGARNAGLEVGVYHYMIEPTGGIPLDGAAEALHFLSEYNKVADLQPSIWNDLEERARGLQSRIDEWAGIVTGATRLDLGAYSGTYFWRENTLDLRKYRYLWLPSWQDDLPTPNYHEQHDVITIWQDNSRESAGGLYPVDHNLTYLAPEQFAALGKRIPDIVIGSTWDQYQKPYGPHNVTIHPFFHAAYAFDTWGYPVGPAFDYTDGIIRQAFERGCMGANGRGEPWREADSFAYAHSTGQKLGEIVYDFADIHPLR